MPITTLGVGAAVTPTVVKTGVSHYTNRKSRHEKPTAHISYDQGLHLIRSFLNYVSHKTVEDLQSFTGKWVPHPAWVRTENVTIPLEHISKAANVIIEQLGNHGVDQVGGTEWWQWRRKDSELRAEWIEMRSDYNERKKSNEKSRRVMVYIHGGAYFFGSVDEHRYQMQRHARKLKARVFAPRYRLAPQFPFPCALQDCLAAYLYLLTIHEPNEIILAGDSAGGGAVVSIMCMLRDRNLPLPAGAVLISPWADCTHSFPSVAGNNELDYIPAHGFMQKPSAAWPPPNEDEIEAIAKGAVTKVAGSALPGKSSIKDRHSAEEEAVKGFAELETHKSEDEMARNNPNNPAKQGDLNPRGGDVIPGPNHQLSIELDGKLVVLKDQIQMYTTNQLLSHPLVSPVLQPSLGGLPPVLILTGGGEVLRDEQIYLAHKMANPTKYHLGDAYRALYDPDDAILNKFKPTPVQLQVWEDLCHVAPTLSFTRPAKYMYRSIAQFGAWTLARAQNRAIEITDDDNISVISSGSSEPESSMEDSTDSLAKQKSKQEKQQARKPAGSVGRARDPLPAFKNHMIRQRVDRHGNTYELGPPEELPALCMAADEVGVIKPGPVRKWMEAKQQWDSKYAAVKRKVQKQRIKELAAGGPVTFGGGESPPPSALAGRRTGKDLAEAKQRKSYGLAMWSMWGSKHDEATIKREEGLERYQQREKDGNSRTGTDGRQPTLADGNIEVTKTRSHSRSRRRASGNKHKDQDGRNLSRRRTVSVQNRGQAEGLDEDVAVVSPGSGISPDSAFDTQSPSSSAHLSPNNIYSPALRIAPHLRTASKDQSEVGSTKTGFSLHSQVSPDDASTVAVFSAPGVVNRDRKATNASSLLVPGEAAEYVGEEGEAGHPGDTRSLIASTMERRTGRGGYDTPVSRGSMERLQSHQLEPLEPERRSFDVAGNASATKRLDPLRSPSSTAIVRAEGVVGVVDGNPEEEEDRPGRPGMYGRGETQFKTAMERL